MKKPMLPSKQALLDAMNLVRGTSIEAIKYLEEKVRQLVAAAKNPEGAELLKGVEDFSKHAELEIKSRARPWSGEIPVEGSLFGALQTNLAEEAIGSLKERKINQEVILDFAIDEQSQFVRIYTSEDQILAEDLTEDYDQLLNAYLAAKNVLTKEGVLYECTENGKIKEDQRGKQIKADAEKVKKLISDPQEGFEKYLDSKGMQLTTREQEYPRAEKTI